MDPLDGTKEFVKKNDEFTVNIALIHQGRPVLGFVIENRLSVSAADNIEPKPVGYFVLYLKVTTGKQYRRPQRSDRLCAIGFLNQHSRGKL